MDAAVQLLAFGGAGLLLGLAAGAALAARRRTWFPVGGGVALLAAVCVLLLLGRISAETADCEGESCGLGAAVAAGALLGNGLGWVVGFFGGVVVRRLVGRASDTA